jgi:hypothetical protein
VIELKSLVAPALHAPALVAAPDFMTDALGEVSPWLTGGLRGTVRLIVNLVEDVAGSGFPASGLSVDAVKQVVSP